MEYKELQKTIEKLDNGVYEICIKNGQIIKINKEKNLTPYQKTEYFLSNYPGLKNRKEYLKKSLDNIELKKIYSINEIKATNKDNLSDVEKIEMIKEERIKEIGEIDYLVDFIDYGLSFVQDDKYKEIIDLIYFKKFKIEGVANKLGIDESTVKRNKSLLVEKIASNLFQNDILEKLNKLIP
jgi:hypothetical protein